MIRNKVRNRSFSSTPKAYRQRPGAIATIHQIDFRRTKSDTAWTDRRGVSPPPAKCSGIWPVLSPNLSRGRSTVRVSCPQPALPTQKDKDSLAKGLSHYYPIARAASREILCGARGRRFQSENGTGLDFCKDRSRKWVQKACPAALRLSAWRPRGTRRLFYQAALPGKNGQPPRPPRLGWQR